MVHYNPGNGKTLVAISAQASFKKMRRREVIVCKKLWLEASPGKNFEKGPGGLFFQPPEPHIGDFFEGQKFALQPFYRWHNGVFGDIPAGRLPTTEIVHYRFSN